jgi:hypothetical protein
MWYRSPAKQKVFVVGLHRAGTQSVHHLLLSAGLKAIHWPAHDRGVDYQAKIVGREADLTYVTDALAPVIDRYDALSDVPIAALYEPLAARYPQARFLAVVRPAHDWVRSIRKHTAERPLDPYEKVLFWRYLPAAPESLATVSDEALTEMHRRHHARLDGFFGSSPQFKRVDLYDQQAGEAICDFLGLARRPLGHVDDVEGKRPPLRRGLRFARVALQNIAKMIAG